MKATSMSKVGIPEHRINCTRRLETQVHAKFTARLTLESILAPIASLKLTVALFAMAIFLVFAGTLAQASHDVWWVLHNYFRSTYVWIDFQVFFPPAWFPSWQHNIGGGFYFPGGFTIGSLMAANLLAAHGLRFKIQSAGPRLWWGLAVIAAGCLITWLVIAAGPGKDGVQATTPVHWKLLWRLFLIGLGAGCVGISAAIVFMDPKRKVERLVLGIVGSALMVLLAYLLFKIDIDAMTSGSMQSAVRVLWQVIEAELAALVLLAGCILMFRKRAGIVLLHAGVGLIMANELVVHFLHKETLMQIAEGETTNFASDIRTFELAVVDTGATDRDQVVVAPERLLRDSAEMNEPIVDAKLPFNARVVQLFDNSELTLTEPTSDDTATAGAGRVLKAVPDRPVTGSDSGERSNLPSAYIELTNKDSGESLGTYLLSTYFGPEKIKVGAKDYEVSLRFQRVYKPYAVHLNEVRCDNYLGTDVPRNYSSDFQLIDPTRGIDRRVAIRMNEPFRYGGETFYQSGNPMSGVTVLSIVSNFGWMIPYVACMIVATGMLYHFSQTLVRFLYRREEGRIVARPTKPSRREKLTASASNRYQKFLPPAIAICAAAFLIWSALPPSYDRNEIDYYSFGKLPVESGGRLQPIDTLARNSLRMLSLRDVYRDENGGLGIGLTNKDGVAVIDRVDPGSSAEAAGIVPGDRIVQIEQESTAGLKAAAVHDLLETADGLSLNLTVSSNNRAPREIRVSRASRPAVKWLLEIASRPEVAENLCVFKVDSLDLLGMLGLKRRPTYRYSWNEINRHRDALNNAVKEGESRNDSAATVFDKKLAELTRRMTLFGLLEAAFKNRPLPELPTDAQRQADPKAAEEIERQIKERLLGLPEFYNRLSEEHPPLAVPPLSQGSKGVEQANDASWLPYSIAEMIKYVQDIRHDPANPATTSWQSIFDAYADQNARDFNRAVRDYSESLADDPPAEMGTGNPTFEAWFNHWSPFFECQWLYFAAFCFAALAWLGWSAPLNRIAFWLIAVTFVAHILALGFRMHIAGRPPITNLYSSAVYIGCGAVLAGLILEYIYRLGFGNVLAAVAGFSTLLVADKLSLVLDNTRGDTIGVQQAVLDTQFWLATHVTCVVTGYTATYVAGLLGLMYVIRGLFTPSLTKDEGKNLVRMIYGTLCFAIFFSFVGTVLGGLWADDSWGRFWGWDPKENGALIIVLWNALVLHARWDGLVKDRGLAVLAIGGNIVTSWSYFGVNQLGVGLHSYGFTEGVLVALGLFCASQLVMIAAGLVPRRFWLSSDLRPAIQAK
jgi:ABC-type transport system involved in cytochrome c biogenesis permease subunit